MGLLGIYLEEESLAADSQWTSTGTEQYTAYFTTDVDIKTASNSLGIKRYDARACDITQVVTDIRMTTSEAVVPFVNPTDPADAMTGTNCRMFAVEIAYGPYDPLNQTPDGDPTHQPIDWGFHWEKDEQPVDVAITGRNQDGSYQFGSVCNSAGDPYDPPVVRDRLRGSVRVVQNSLTFDPSVYFAYGNMINTANWNGFPPFSVKLEPPDMPQRTWSQFLNRFYYRLEYNFVVNPDPTGWNAAVIDRGTRFLYNGVPTHIFDPKGMPVTEPVLLNGVGQVYNTVNPSNYYQQVYQVYYDIDFNQTFPLFSSLFAGG